VFDTSDIFEKRFRPRQEIKPFPKFRTFVDDRLPKFRIRDTPPVTVEIPTVDRGNFPAVNPTRTPDKVRENSVNVKK